MSPANANDLSLEMRQVGRIHMQASPDVSESGVTGKPFAKYYRAMEIPACDSSSPTIVADTNNDKLQRWNDAGFKNSIIETWTDPELYCNLIDATKPFTHGVKFTIVVFRNAGFTIEYIKRRIQRLAEIYSKCAIKIQNVDLVESDAPNGWIDVEDPLTIGKGTLTYKIAKLLPLSERPVLFYVRSLGNGTIAAHADLRSVHGKKSPRHDLIWITASVNTEYPDPNYLTEAHELGHILGNLNHDTSGKKNFLSETWGLLSDDIRYDQCEAMKSSVLVNSL